MIDTHCHLDRCKDTDAVIRAAFAEAEGLAAAITIGIDPASCQRAVALAEQHKRVFAAVGLHPTNAEQIQDADARAAITELATHPKVVAIGESGFDYYWDAASPEAQRESFFWQAELANKLEKPLILHVRDKQGARNASAETAQRLQEADCHRGILHCFNGDEGLLETGLALGLMVSFAGNVTFKKAPAIQASAKVVPEACILVETDSPYLAPVPKRGKPNQPSYVRHTAAFVAQLREVDVAVLEQQTDANARHIYNLPPL
jgi:TatD DNase family protein